MGKWFGRRTAPGLALTPSKPQLPILSVSAQLVLRSYSALPDANKPAFDLVPMLEALDVKYGFERASDHMTYEVWDQDMWGFADTDMTRWRTDFAYCSCRADYDDEGWIESEIETECSMPEYEAICDEIDAIQDALREQEWAAQRHEREVELAGIEPMLRSVEDLTAALRAERSIVQEVTEMLVAPLAPQDLSRG